MKLGLLMLAFLYVAVPFFVGMSREWTPRLRPSGYVFTIFLHAVLFAAAYCMQFRDRDFLLNFLFICWWNLTLYGGGRLFTVFAQGRFMNWVDSLTPEQQLARVLMVGTFLAVCFAPQKFSFLRQATRDATSIQKSRRVLPFELPPIQVIAQRSKNDQREQQ